MPGTVKLRSVKKFGQENDGYELSDEGKLLFYFLQFMHIIHETQT